MYEPRRPKIGSFKEMIGECKYISLTCLLKSVNIHNFIIAGQSVQHWNSYKENQIDICANSHIGITEEYETEYQNKTIEHLK